MSDIAAIKDRIKKLMAFATEGKGATDAEIDTYMAMAAKLIDAHHLDKADFTTEEEEAEFKMGTAFGQTESPKVHLWETTLAAAIEQLFGCIKHYLDNKAVPFRINGIAQFYTGKYAGQMKMCRRICFYGPLMESEEAASLYQEWVASIAAMAVMRWGGAYKGDGAKYAQGFAHSLFLKASAINTKRRLVQAKPLAALPGAATTAITLKGRYEALQERAKDWLEKDKGIKLQSSDGRSGSQDGSDAAYHEGRSHGKAASFGRKGTHKQLPGA